MEDDDEAADEAQRAPDDADLAEALAEKDGGEDGADEDREGAERRDEGGRRKGVGGKVGDCVRGDRVSEGGLRVGDTSSCAAGSSTHLLRRPLRA